MNDHIKNYLKKHWVKEITYIELVVVMFVLFVFFKDVAKEVTSILGMWYLIDLLEKVSSFANDKILGTEEDSNED
jgi:hypothetical protein|nr:MAG TPA: hypothetical protein [Caudoviricetes sp.]